MRILTIHILVMFALTSFGADDIQGFIAGMDWQTQKFQSVKASGDAPFIISVTCEKENVWKKLTFTIGIQAVAKNDPRFPALAGNGWGTSGGSRAIGSLLIGDLNKEGFRADLDVRWTDKVRGVGTFTERLQCKWADHQTFEKDGFKIEVTIKPNRPAIISE